MQIGGRLIAFARIPVAGGLAIVTLLLAGPAQAGAGGVGGAALESALQSAQQRSGAPGAQAAVVQDGRLLWAGSSGTLQPGSSAPVAPSTLFALASVTKTYTAALTLRLVEAGRLGLDDTVGQWLGDRVAAPVRPVQVRDLLQMTSGLPDYLEAPSIETALEDPDHHWTLRELLRAIGSPRHAGVFNYSNSNYILLGAIDARAGGAPVPALLSRLVLAPLGLGQTFLRRRPRLASRFSPGYEILRGGHLLDTFPASGAVPTSLWGPLFTDGGIASDATEVARFANALFGGRLLSPATLATMLAPGPGGEYEMGAYAEPFDGHEWQGHDGAFDGFSSDSFTDRSRDLTVVVLANGMNRYGEVDPADIIWRALARSLDAEGTSTG